VLSYLRDLARKGRRVMITVSWQATPERGPHIARQVTVEEIVASTTDPVRQRFASRRLGDLRRRHYHADF
jgi:hypothetical protein